MAHKVTNMQEVNYIGMSEKESKEIWRLDDLRAEQMSTCFDDDDYFALYKDVDANDRESNDDRTYAVYMHNSGNLLCLLVDAGSALEGYEDCEYGDKRNELYKQIAMLAGWPKKLPAKKAYTVQLKRTIEVKVYADSYAQAEWIGRNLAACDTEWKCMVVNEAMCNGDDSFDGVYKPTERSWWHLDLTEDECNELLKED